MSNLILAQTTAPSPAAESGAVLLFSLLAAGSAMLITRRKLWPLMPVPAEPGAPILGLAAAIAATMYITASAICGRLVGLTPETTKLPEVMRQVVLCQPAIQLITAGGIIAILAMELPRALHWATSVWRPIKSGFGTYFLAMPWVLLTGIATVKVAERIDPEASTKHMIFDLWQSEAPGVTPFKVVAVFSAVVAAPIVEELFFRGILQRLVERMTGRAVFAIVAASLLFMAIHDPWTTRPPIFVLSMFLGWLYFRTGSILAPIAMHALFNALQFALFFAIAPEHSVPPA